MDEMLNHPALFAIGCVGCLMGSAFAARAAWGVRRGRAWSRRARRLQGAAIAVWLAWVAANQTVAFLSARGVLGAGARTRWAPVSTALFLGAGGALGLALGLRGAVRLAAAGRRRRGLRGWAASVRALPRSPGGAAWVRGAVRGGATLGAALAGGAWVRADPAAVAALVGQPGVVAAVFGPALGVGWATTVVAMRGGARTLAEGVEALTLGMLGVLAAGWMGTGGGSAAPGALAPSARAVGGTGGGDAWRTDGLLVLVLGAFAVGQLAGALAPPRLDRAFFGLNARAELEDGDGSHGATG